ncbi:MAG: hypothetical protein SPL55_06350 [Prevotella sp.]|nr:hypothetical protein [Prevotella sp.]
MRKVTYDEALARLKHSLAIRKDAMRKAEKRWASKSVQGKVIFL